MFYIWFVDFEKGIDPVIRAEGTLAQITMGKIQGKRVRGRQRLGWLDEIRV